MCCTRLAENTGRKNDAKTRHLGTIAQLCRVNIFATKACIDNRKNLLNGNISSICPHNILNFGILTAEICWRVWAPQQILTGFAFWLRYCSDVAQRKSTKFCTMFGRRLAWYTLYTHFRQLLSPDVILPRVKCTLCPSTHHRTSLSGYIFASKACMDNRKK